MKTSVRWSMKRFGFTLLTAAALLAATDISVGQNATAPKYWPTHGWHTSTPEQQGLDSEKLAEAFDLIRQRQINIHSLLIVRNGDVVLDASFYPYQAGQLHDLASVTKSVTTTLIGIAIGQGKLTSVNQSLLTIFPQRTIANQDARKKQLAVKELLTMTSGLACRFQPHEITLEEMRQSKDWVQFMLDLPMVAEPGSKYEYCSGGMHLLSGIISQTTGRSALEYARRELFQPLGIEEAVWPSDPQGVTYGWGDLHLQPSDAAKLGYLWLNNGQWEGRQIVPADWMKNAISVQSRASWGDEYGYGIWVYPARGVFEGLGRGGQRISVVPSKNLVVVFTGGGFEPGDIGNLIGAALKSDQPLPANPAGMARLTAAISTARQAPAALAAPRLPEIAQQVSGKTYLLETNPLSLTKLALTFASPTEATAQLTFADKHVETHPVGLDGVVCLSAGRFGLPVGWKGQWERQTFVLDYDEIANINHLLLRVDFAGPRLTVQMTEKTGGATAKFNGKWE